MNKEQSAVEEEKKEQVQVISEQPNRLDGMSAKKAEASGKKLLLLGLTALGVVYGDIGTSPLYAFRFAFSESGHITRTPENILGILSLIFWSLTIVISIKYLIYVMMADNEGEGGILALMALLVPSGGRHKRWLIVALGVFGAALLYGDGMITPAISVLSAIEGLKVATTEFNHFIIPITVAILILLFLLQKRGTQGVGSIFGPVMFVWFTSIGVLGIRAIFKAPQVLQALNPWHALDFFFRNGWVGFLVLGAVFLVVTGGEALYADMGHFGSRPIRLAWFTLVFPALLINYFGQGALLLSSSHYISQPFYALAPHWALYPLVILATLATIIASQAVISGAFSLTRQSALLGEFPRIKIVQTSSSEIGQIYIPLVNWILMITTIGLVLAFKKSDNLAAAYGVAVTTTMVITTILAYILTREKWGWNMAASLSITIGFLIVDLAFFIANMTKVADGGWFPLLVAIAVFTLMSTWRRGRQLLTENNPFDAKPLKDFVHKLSEDPPVRVSGTAIFLTGHSEGTPPLLSYHLEHNQALHEKVLIVTVMIQDVPKVPPSQRLEIQEMELGFYRVKISYGFMENPDVPKALRTYEEFGLDNESNVITYYIGRQILIPREEKPKMAKWRKELFTFMSRNSALTTTFYELPPQQVVEIGIHVHI